MPDKKAKLRINDRRIINELADELRFCLSNIKNTREINDAGTFWRSLSHETLGGRYIYFDKESSILHAFIFDQNAGDGSDPIYGVSFNLAIPPEENDIRLVRAYVRLFISDLRDAPEQLAHQELWVMLKMSRAARVIARLSPFSTAPVLQWITTMDTASSLTYEGESFQSIVLMSKQAKWITGAVGVQYIPLKRPLKFRKAVLEEKWIRALMKSSSVALHGVSFSGDIVGTVAISRKNTNSKGNVIAPNGLVDATSLVVDGTMAFVSAQNGDLYTVLPNGMFFGKTQGRWHYFNFSGFRALLLRYVPAALTKSLLALLLDLSYARTGALVCIPDSSASLPKLVPDHGVKRRPNLELRSAADGLRLDMPAHRAFLMAAAGVDGAIIVSRDGVVLDVACMIGEPTNDELASLNIRTLQRFPGARSTAAWNASIFGIAIKVSEDGPITVFSKGVLVGQLG